MARILIAEDDAVIAEMIGVRLANSGPRPSSGRGMVARRSSDSRQRAPT